MKLPSGNTECLIEVQGDTVIRTYSGQQAEMLVEILNTGVLEEIQHKELLMPMSIQVTKEPKLKVVVRQSIGEIIYPAEWTSSMVAEIGLKTLELFEVLDKFGCGLLDSHGQNWVFLDGYPRFVDLGSFALKRHDWEYVFPEFEFALSFILPVKLFSKGRDLLSRMFLNQERFSQIQLEETSHLLARGPERCLLGFLPKKLKPRFRTIFYASYRDLGATEIPARFMWGMPLYRVFVKTLAIPLAKLRIRRYRQFLNMALRQLSVTGSLWGKYAQSIEDKDEPRLDHVLGAMHKLSPSQILDVGGNTGYLGRRYQAEFDSSCHYTVLDFDSDAINTGIALTREGDGNLAFLQYDFVNPFTSPNLLSVEDRFPAEVVVSLALTHHLVLTGNMSFALLAARYSNLAKDWLLVEFMPLGLWVPSAPVDIANGYNRENFVDAFQEYFDLESEIQLEVNRILFTFRRLRDEKAS